MSLTCQSCAAPMPDGTTATVLGTAIIYGHGMSEVEAYDLLCPDCGAAIEAEVANITEPRRLIFEIAPELRAAEADRLRIYKLLSWFMDYSDTLALRIGATIVRFRVEPADAGPGYRLVVTSTIGTHIFSWNHENTLLVGEGDEDNRIVLNLEAIGVGVDCE